MKDLITDSSGTMSKADPKVIVPSPFNKDRSDTKEEPFKEFMESIRQHGIIQPPVVRKLPANQANGKQFELIAGERRWRAALLLQLPEIPIIIREADDALTIELQTIENDKRKDLSPIQKAEKYQQALEAYKASGLTGEKAMARLCERLSKGKATVYEALSLIALPDPVKKLVAANKLPASHAGLLAKLNDSPEAQTKLLGIIAPADTSEMNLYKLEEDHDLYEASRDGDGVLSFRDTKELVEAEAKLTKARQAWADRAEQHFAKGGEIMTEEQMSKSISSYGHAGAGYVQATDTTYDYGQSKDYQGKRYNSLWGKHAPPKILAHDHSYKVVEVYRKKDVEAAIAKNGIKKKQSNSGGGGAGHSTNDYAKQEKARKEKAARMKPVGEKAAELVRAAAKKGKPKFSWALFLTSIFRHYNIPGGGVTRKQIAAADKLTEAQLHSMLVEIQLGDASWREYSNQWEPKFVELCGHYGIDLKKLEKEIAPPAAKPQASGPAKKTGKAKKK